MSSFLRFKFDVRNTASFTFELQEELILADDTFNFNYGQAKTACGQFIEAEEALQAVKDPRIRTEPVYTSCLVRCLIMNGKAPRAWELCSSLRVKQHYDLSSK